MRKKLTEYQKELNRAAQKRYRDGLTESKKAEFRLKKNQAQKKRLAEMTPEEKEHRREYMRFKNKNYKLNKDQRLNKNIASRAWEKANPIKVKNRRLNRIYGITVTQWQELFLKQNSTCAICKSNNPGKSNGGWHTDHCHYSGKVRGILCNNCNMAIGLFKDSDKIMLAAAAYITEHNA